MAQKFVDLRNQGFFDDHEDLLTVYGGRKQAKKVNKMKTKKEKKENKVVKKAEEVDAFQHYPIYMTFTVPLIVAVEGMIGVGKSTILTVFEEQQINGSAFIFKERLKEWQTPQENGKSVLDMYYKDTRKNAFSLQSTVLSSMVKRSLDAREMFDQTTDYSSWILQERSVMASLEVFIRENEHHMSKELFDLLVSSTTNVINTHESNQIRIGIILDLDTNFKRMKKRARPSETHITRRYFERVYWRYYFFIWEKCHYVISTEGKQPEPTPYEYATTINAIVNAYRDYTSPNVGEDIQRDLDELPLPVRRTNVPLPVPPPLFVK